MARHHARVLGPAVLVAGIALLVLVTGCGVGTRSGSLGASVAPNPPAESAEPTAAAEYFFPSVRLVDVELRNRSVAYWRVETEATPTASAALAAIEFMGRKYRDQGRAMILRVDVGPAGPIGRSHNPALILVWNPTTGPIDSGLLPPGITAPRTLTLFALLGFDITHRPVTSSDVTTESLKTGAPGHALLLQTARNVGGLR